MILFKHYPQLKTIQELAKRRKCQIHLVGGFLRDYVLSAQKKDFDFAVSEGALCLAKAFATKIKGAFVVLDEGHGCARVVKKVKGQVYTFDFADFRAKTLKGDLSHRDFNINTLSLDLLQIDDQTFIDDVIKDYKGGIKDFKAKRICMVSSKVFKEDPLRMMRAFALKAILNFKIDRSTLAQIKKDAALIHNISYERMTVELFKILESPRAAETIKAMDRIGLLSHVIPQIRVMVNCKQGTYHHLDVWPHSMEAVVQLEGVFEQFAEDIDIKEYLNQTIGGKRTRRSIIKLATLLHDIGKPDTRKREMDGRLSFHGHEHVGKNIAKHVCNMLKVSTKERHAVEDMVRWHLRPGYLSNFKKPTARAIYRYFRDTKEEAVSILLLSLADQRSTQGPLTTEADQKHHEKICCKLLRYYFAKQKEEPFVCLINGMDLKKKLKLQPSPLFGKILAEVAEQQTLGKVKTKSEALALAKKIVSKT